MSKKLETSNIRVVALDLGNVVVDIDLESALRDMGIEKSWHELSQWKTHWDYETGKISSQEFYQSIINEFKLEKNLLEIERAWLNIIQGIIPGMESLMRDLSSKFYLVAITNTNQAHLDHFQTMAEFQWFHRIFASHIVRHRKPQTELFQYVIDELKVKPSEIIFFDDLQENVDAAKLCGISAHHCFKNPQLIQELTKG